MFHGKRFNSQRLQKSDPIPISSAFHELDEAPEAGSAQTGHWPHQQGPEANVPGGPPGLTSETRDLTTENRRVFSMENWMWGNSRKHWDK
jgi:hypothetical protein